MRKILIIVSLPFLIFNEAKAQKDTVGSKKVIVEINPTYGIGSLIKVEGEYGVNIGIPIKVFPTQRGVEKKIELLLGAGYNEEFNFNRSLNEPKPDGTGYTTRVGLRYNYGKRKVVSFILSYRHWDINGIINYWFNDNPTTLDPVLSPVDAFFPGLDGVGSEESPAPVSKNNAKVNVAMLDIMWGGKHPLFKNKIFFIEWFLGTGLRYKTMQYEQTGNYIFPSSFNVQSFPFPFSAYYEPISKPVYTSFSSFVPDFKLGITIGFIL